MEKGVWQGCVLVPLLFNMNITLVLLVAEKHIIADAAIMDSIVQLQRKEEKGETRGKTRVGNVDEQGKEEEAQMLRGMLNADDAGIVWRSPGGLEIMITVIGGLEIMITVIVTACAAFGLAVSEANMDTMCPQTNHRGKVSFAVIAAGQVFKQTIELVYLGGAVSVDRNLSIEATRRLQRAWSCLAAVCLALFPTRDCRKLLNKSVI